MTDGAGGSVSSEESQEDLRDETNAVFGTPMFGRLGEDFLNDPDEGFGDGFSSAAATLSGASGKHLKDELEKYMQRGPRVSRIVEEQERYIKMWAGVEYGVAVVYDKPLSAMFNFFYDVLQFSSGRDKVCAFFQGFAKFASAEFSEPASEAHWMYRGIEDSLSDGRKVFRLFKEFREVYKVRRGINRFIEGVSQEGICSIPAACGFVDIFGHTASFFYYLFDNLLWAASVGIVRAKEMPKHGFWKNGVVMEHLGGLRSVKRRKNWASMWRLNFGIIANTLLLRRACSLCPPAHGFQGLDDPRLFHTIELLGMFANYSILWSKLGFSRLSHTRLGLLAMLASVCGIWSNWRKVVRKRCGTKTFATTLARRPSF